MQVVTGFNFHLANLAMGDNALILNGGGALLVALHEVEDSHLRRGVGPGSLFCLGSMSPAEDLVESR